MTPFVQSILLANVIGFLLQGLMPELMASFALWPGRGSGFAGTLPWTAPWQLLTYSFLHADIWHIAFNMLAVWMFGSQIEQVWGTRRLALTYFISVVTGALCHLLVGMLFGAGGGPVIGASAGVFGILLAYALLFPHNKVILLIPPIPLPARVFVGLYAALELFLGVTGTQEGVAHFAHLGGLIGGWIGWRYGLRWSVRRR
ncbi:MAG: rhomboid family intramembrane serine protease [Burkholderiaceae bacterium]